jgi:hypothetical protein
VEAIAELAENKSYHNAKNDGEKGKRWCANRRPALTFGYAKAPSEVPLYRSGLTIVAMHYFESLEPAKAGLASPKGTRNEDLANFAAVLTLWSDALPRLEAKRRFLGRADRPYAAYLRAAQAYMLISMPTGTSTIFGVFQVIGASHGLRRDNVRAAMKLKQPRT